MIIGNGSRKAKNSGAQKQEGIKKRLERENVKGEEKNFALKSEKEDCLGTMDWECA